MFSIVQMCFAANNSAHKYVIVTTFSGLALRSKMGDPFSELSECDLN